MTDRIGTLHYSLRRKRGTAMKSSRVSNKGDLRDQLGPPGDIRREAPQRVPYDVRRVPSSKVNRRDGAERRSDGEAQGVLSEGSPSQGERRVSETVSGG